MEEQFILRVPPSVAERIESLLAENASSSDDKSLDLTFQEDGRSGKFVIGNDQFPAYLLDLPSIVESYKTYDDNVLIKAADIGQMIMVKEDGDSIPDEVEHRDGLTPPMRDARRRKFRRDPDLNPELVQRVEKDLQSIMAGGTAENIDVEHAEKDKGENKARNVTKQAEHKPPEEPGEPDAPEAGTAGAEAEPDGSDSEETDDSI